MRKVLLFAAITVIAFFYSCKRTVSDNDVLQITDVIELDGRLEDSFLSSWEYVVLDDSEINAAVPGMVDKILYDDGFFFISSNEHGKCIKVYDRNGHYLNDISHFGRGRNEFVDLHDWIIDRNKKEVLLTSQDGFQGPVIIKKFDYQGNYLGQVVTDSIRDMNTFGHVAKCLSDGTLLIQNGLTLIPVYDFYYVPQSGPVSFPLEMKEHHIPAADGYSVDDVKQEMKSTGGYYFNFIVSWSYLNPLTDTTYLVRILDNHIYRLTENGSECVANMAFRPQITEKEIKNYDTNDGMSPLIAYDIYDMKDYLYLWYPSYGDYLYDKTTSKVYHFNRESSMRSLPDYREMCIYGNDKIGCVDVDIISRHIEEMESDDYDHRYSPELEDFYRKVKGCENPVIFIAHYDKKPR
jgi:hypothetical protein